MLSLKPIFAEGRETRPNSRPVATAKPRTPSNASNDATMFAAVPFGEILPHPTALKRVGAEEKGVEKTPPPGGRVGAQKLTRAQRIVGRGE